MGIKIENSKGNFTSLGGLALVDEILSKTKLKSSISTMMPTSKRISADLSFNKFKTLLMGFVAGADCIDDMAHLALDAGFRAVSKDKVFIPNVYGSYLRSFEPWQVRRLNDSLRDYAFLLRKKAFKDDNKLIIDIDSTHHQQSGQKIEGVAYNYKNEWCLSSLQAFDQYGFQYAMEVRSGSTFTSIGVAKTIRNIFSYAPRKMHRFMRGDSGMCNIDIFNACEENNVDFVIAMRTNMFESIHTKLNYWQWQRAKNTKTRDGRECEIACAPYFPEGSRKCLRVVVIRALKKNPDLFGDRYDHYAFVSNISESEMSHEDLLKFYQKRGNAENYIRELKNGFDIHHFPCQSLQANNVYGLIAGFAYNCMRFLSSVLNPEQMHFSKKIRFRMIYIGAQVVRKARSWIIRMSNTKLEEVAYWLTEIKRRLVVGYMSG